MCAEMGWSSKRIKALTFLLLTIILGHGFATAQDTDGSDIWVPGCGGGTGLGSYVGPGLEIRLSYGFWLIERASFTQFILTNGTGDLKLDVEFDTKSSGILVQDFDKVFVEGDYSAELNLEVIFKDQVNLKLKKDLDTHTALAFFFIGDLGNITAKDLMKKMESGDPGSSQVMLNQGHLELSSLLKAVFKPGSDVDQIGLVQMEFDDEGTVVRKTAMIMKKESASFNVSRVGPVSDYISISTYTETP
jgi:hypothetical protein